MPVFGQGKFVVDQQSFADQLELRDFDARHCAITFTPTFSSVGFLKVVLGDAELAGATGAQVVFNLRADSDIGPILGTTGPIGVAPGDSLLDFTFIFSTPVALTPGTQYFLEPVDLLGHDQFALEIGEAFVDYPGGGIVGDSTHNIWFQEGIVSAGAGHLGDVWTGRLLSRLGQIEEFASGKIG